MKYLLIGLLFLVGCTSSTQPSSSGQQGKIIIERIQTKTDIYYKDVDDTGINECFNYRGKLVSCEFFNNLKETSK